MTDIKTNDGALVINGVKARMTIQSVKAGQAAGLWFNQRIVTAARKIKSGEYVGCYIKVEMRFDDSCGNGHNTFSIGGEINRSQSFADRTHEASGCIHDEIAEHFPELAFLIKWHLVSSDSPMHYLANTIYHAGDRDHNGKRKGEPTHFEEHLYFGHFPISFSGKKLVRDFLKTKADVTAVHDYELLVTPVPHREKGKPGAYQFGDKYTFAGCVQTDWTYAPFDSKQEAEEWALAIKMGWRFDRVAVAFSEGKERDFDAARSCAVWPDATDEQLSMEPELLRAELEKRLPALTEAFKVDVTKAGFAWSPEDFK